VALTIIYARHHHNFKAEFPWLYFVFTSQYLQNLNGVNIKNVFLHYKLYSVKKPLILHRNNTSFATAHRSLFGMRYKTKSTTPCGQEIYA